MEKKGNCGDGSCSGVREGEGRRQRKRDTVMIEDAVR